MSIPSCVPLRRHWLRAFPSNAWLLACVLGLLGAWPAEAQIRATQSRRIQARPAPRMATPAPQTPGLSFQTLVQLQPQGACTSNNAWPWTTRYSPDGQSLYVSLFGGFAGSGGCAVLKLDAQNLTWQATLPTQEAPEEILFVTSPGGALTRTLVTNSSASSVSVFDGSDAPLATIAIPVRPTSPWGTAFPFGMALSPDQNTVWVGTGEGTVFAIDVPSLTLDPSRTLDYGDDHGFARLAFAGQRLLLTTTQYHPSFVGSTASLMALDPNFPGTETEVFLSTSNTTALYPSPQDIAVHSDGRVFVSGFDMGAQVFVIEPLAGVLLAQWPTFTQPSAGKLQALGLHGDFLMAADYWSGEIARIDTRSGGVAGMETVQVFGQGPNEITFSVDGSAVVIPLAGSDELVQFAVQ